MPKYVEIIASGELAEVVAEVPRTGKHPAGVRVRRLNTDRSDFGASVSLMTWVYPLTHVRPADMTRWHYDPASNRWACAHTR